MKPNLFKPVFFAMAVTITCSSLASDSTKLPGTKGATSENLTLPAGFTASTMISQVGNNRHIAVAPNGDIYVKLARLKEGKGIVILRDANKDGKLEVAGSLGNFTGTGIAFKNGYLYASSDDAIFRYKLSDQGTVADTDNPETIVKGLWNRRQHASKSFALDNAGNIYVNIGAPSNACQVVDRTKGSPGQDPCPILDSAGGIWQFKADKLNQGYADGVRYSTGLRNVVGLDWNNNINELFAMQHGRDALNTLYPEMFNAEQSAEIPAEEMFLVKNGSNFGWPYCYYDPIQKKKVLAPEYGGDGKKQDRCESMGNPVMAFPGHWAPNAMLFYSGNMFPEKYRNGVFIAFHGSWNRAPLKQKGYNVVFVPFKDGKPSGDYEVFADGFKGATEIDSPGQAEHRPCGLAQGADGALYISDSVKGTIWKITYRQ